MSNGIRSAAMAQPSVAVFNVSKPMAAPLPSIGFLRLPQIIGDSEAKPPQPPIVPVCKTTWWAGVKSGRYPKPIKLSPRVTVWRVEDVLALIAHPEVRPMP